METAAVAVVGDVIGVGGGGVTTRTGNETRRGGEIFFLDICCSGRSGDSGGEEGKRNRQCGVSRISCPRASSLCDCFGVLCDSSTCIPSPVLCAGCASLHGPSLRLAFFLRSGTGGGLAVGVGDCEGVDRICNPWNRLTTFVLGLSSLCARSSVLKPTTMLSRAGDVPGSGSERLRFEVMPSSVTLQLRMKSSFPVGVGERR